MALTWNQTAATIKRTHKASGGTQPKLAEKVSNGVWESLQGALGSTSRIKKKHDLEVDDDALRRNFAKPRELTNELFRITQHAYTDIPFKKLERCEDKLWKKVSEILKENSAAAVAGINDDDQPMEMAETSAAEVVCESLRQKASKAVWEVIKHLFPADATYAKLDVDDKTLIGLEKDKLVFHLSNKVPAAYQDFNSDIVLAATRKLEPITKKRKSRQHSDHNAVTLHLARDRRRKSQSTLSVPRYPIRAANQDKAIAELQQELASKGVGEPVQAQEWDATIALCQLAIKVITNRTKSRRRKSTTKLRRRRTNDLLTRHAIIQAEVDDVMAAGLYKLGERLELTPANVRWKFRQWSNWDRDQHVTDIQAASGDPFPRDFSIADKIAREWSTVLGRLHSKLHSRKEVHDALRAFVSLPSGRRVTHADNMGLMKVITEQDVGQAITQLRRNKAAVPDGLSNDLYQDVAGVLIPALTAISNDLLKGKTPPPSFLQATIIPLRKKGDSDNAMDYRPISLLQSSYKIVMTILASRMQTFLGRLIGSAQQGFVHGRQLTKTVAMMLAQLQGATADSTTDMEDSAGILLLDFKKAYDTLSRVFILEVLELFGFDPRFITLIDNMHAGTTAQFLVNGELSRSVAVVTGIRQGCPLAPLLFILAVEILGLALQQNDAIRGIPVPGSPEEKRHLFSAFVDDSTIFLDKSSQLPTALALVRRFGDLSGLRVQPDKSHYIFLNTSISAIRFHGIPVLQADRTTRYLGYQVGTGLLREVNWADRIRRIRTRLRIAGAHRTSVADRVLILNVIMLPSVLYTAAMFPPDQDTISELECIQKQFLWTGAPEKERMRHKLNPGLIHTPQRAGGLGLASIGVAMKIQRVKHAILWLLRPCDSYKVAWHSWQQHHDTILFPSGEWAPSPRARLTRAPPRHRRAPPLQLAQELGELLGPPPTVRQARQEQASAATSAILNAAFAWWETHDTNSLLFLTTGVSFPILDPLPQEIESFWMTFSWADNPWICGQHGEMLSQRQFRSLRPCRLNELCIRRVDDDLFTVTIPYGPGRQRHRDCRTLIPWFAAILIATPRAVRARMGVESKEVTLRRQPTCLGHYKWLVKGNQEIQGTPTSEGVLGYIRLKQNPDGITWSPVTAAGNDALHHDFAALRLFHFEEGIVFLASPLLHGFPWAVSSEIKNRHVLKAIKQQPAKAYMGGVRNKLGPIVKKLLKLRENSAWTQAVQSQRPKELWARRGVLTDFQIWTVYRVATAQLNLYHPDRIEGSHCRITRAVAKVKSERFPNL